jgi:hypothetical protein
MTHRPLITLALSLVLAGFASILTPGCSGEDGQVPNDRCKPFPLYDISAAGERNAPSVETNRQENVDAGCMSDLSDAATTP